MFNGFSICGYNLMNKFSVIVFVLCLSLVFSLGVNLYMSGQNGVLLGEKSDLSSQVADLAAVNQLQVAELQMVDVLSQVQVQVSLQLRQIGESLVYACEQLSNVGLAGEQARQILTELAENNSVIIDVCTFDLNSTFVTMVPSQYSYLEGTSSRIAYSVFSRSQNPIQPILFDMMLMTEGFNASSLMAPVFDSAGEMIGSVSVIFDPNELIGSVVSGLVEGTSFTMWAIQLDSMEIYDADASQVGLKLLEHPAYEPFADFLAFTQQIISEESGHGTYRLFRTIDSGEIVDKNCFWATVSEYGNQWRLVIIDIIS